MDEHFVFQGLEKWMQLGSGYTVTREEDEEEGETVITIQKKKPGKGKQGEEEEITVTDDERWELVKKELIEVIRDYGDTIARASQNEWFTLFAHPLKTSWTSKEIRRLVIRVQMKHISDYNGGKLDEAGFKKQVQIIEY